MTRDDDATTAASGAQPTVVHSGGEAAPLDGDAFPGGSKLGRYIVIEHLGTGAMGIVLRAYDAKLQREVALKLVRSSGGAKAELAEARLLREAHALARLNHPNVVAVYDVDTTEQGVVIAMEYVHGRSLRAWLAERRRAWPEALAVVLAAARGLASAHAAELVHRDVKPDNILVGSDDDDPQSTGRVRVTDFGLARARTIYAPSDDPQSFSGEGWSVDEQLTQVGTVMGTPGYMAPEQHAGASADPRSDQYALCVTIWEALYGRRPFSGRGMKALAEAKQQGTPPPPSKDVPSWLHRVIARGLAVNPEERWPSVDALADALASGSGRARRHRAVGGFAIVGAAALVLVGTRQVDRLRRIEHCRGAGETLVERTWNDGAQKDLEAGILATGLGFAPMTHEQTHAWIERYVEEWRDLRVRACMAAEVEDRWSPDLHARAEQCFEERRDHLAALLEVITEGERESVLRAVGAVAVLPSLDACMDEVALARRPSLPDEPEKRARAEELRRKLVRARGLGSAGRSADGLVLGREIVEQAGAEGIVSLELAAELATGGLAENVGHYEEAEQRLRRALLESAALGYDELAADAALSLIHVVGLVLNRHGEGFRYADLARILIDRIESDERSARHGRLCTNLANLHARRSEYEEALPLHEEALEIAERFHGSQHPALAPTLNNLVMIHGLVGNHEQAEALAKRSLELSEATLGPDHPEVAFALQRLAATYEARRRYDEAEPLFERSLAIREAALGPDHPYLAWSLTHFGIALGYRYENERAMELFRRALEIRMATLGPEHPDVAWSFTNIGLVHDRLGEYEDAEAAFERALAIREATEGRDDPLVASSLTNIGLTKKARGELDEARALLERALAIREAKLGPEDPQVAYTLAMLAGVRSSQGAHDEAHALHVRAVRILEDAAEPGAIELAQGLERFADFQLERGDLDAAESLYRRARSLREADPKLDSQALAPFVGLGRVALRRGRPAEAIEPLERAVSMDERFVFPPLVAQARFVLARALWESRGERTRARRLAREAHDLLQRVGKPAEQELAEVVQWLARHDERSATR